MRRRSLATLKEAVDGNIERSLNTDILDAFLCDERRRNRSCVRSFLERNCIFPSDLHRLVLQQRQRLQRRKFEAFSVFLIPAKLCRIELHSEVLQHGPKNAYELRPLFVGLMGQDNMPWLNAIDV